MSQNEKFRGKLPDFALELASNVGLVLTDELAGQIQEFLANSAGGLPPTPQPTPEPKQKEAQMPQTDKLPKQTVKMVMVTPELAAKWLASRNMTTPGLKERPVREGWVEILARQMTNNLWRATNDAICFTPEGVLINGQHRLLAIVRSGVTVELPVAYNVPQNAYHTMDSVNRRTPSDILFIDGESYTRELASGLRTLLQYLKNDVNFDISRQHATIELEQILEANPGMRESTRWVVGQNKARLLPNSLAITLHYLFSQKDAEAAQEFFTGVFRGELLAEGTPIMQLRARLIDNRAAKHRKVRPTLLAALTIKAWNLFRAGNTVSILQFRSTGPSSEFFPDISD